MSGPNYTIMPGDWINLEAIINDLSSRVLTSPIDTLSLSCAVSDAYSLASDARSVAVDGGSTNHNSLLSLQGGQAGQYYHFNQSEYNELHNWLDNVVLGSDGALTLDKALVINESDASGWAVQGPGGFWAKSDGNHLNYFLIEGSGMKLYFGVSTSDDGFIQPDNGGDLLFYCGMAGDNVIRVQIDTDGNTTIVGGDLIFADAKNIRFNTTTGTKIGTTTGQKIGFWNVAPVIQPSHIVDADGTLNDITTKFNTLLAQMATIGLQAAS